MGEAGPEPGGHPDRLRWNAKYESGAGASFTAHPLAAAALSAAPDGAVLDLACGPSGSTLLAASAGRRVTAVDVSDVALELLGREARRRGLDGLITLVQADLGTWRPEGGFAVVLCTGFWDRDVFGRNVEAVAAGGSLGWEAFTLGAREERPGLPLEWCLGADEPRSLLPGDFTVVQENDLPNGKRRLLARRA
ncbi:class I SAM-dependent methyltransferase [Spirillospora sp. NPDC047279]|uniref:SAM-dependent methyltransferase n=1 Tax=Spirillospora sp. NPDC047279 TaxID=3155478 RepID=UPI003406675B